MTAICTSNTVYLVLVVVLLATLLQFLLQGALLSGQPNLVHVPHVRRTLGKLEKGLELLRRLTVLILKRFLWEE